MSKNKGSSSVSNDGENRGVMASDIHGSIDNRQYTLALPEQKKYMPSLIAEIVEALADITILPDEEIDKRYKVRKEDLEPYDIDNKISYNHLIKYKDTINEYSYYGSICEEAFNIVDNYRMGSKGKILRDIKRLYNLHKGQLISENQKNEIEVIDIIRANADRIIDLIKEQLENRIIQDSSKEIFIEDLEEGLIRILCYAFVECKVLEKPGDEM